MHIQFAPETWEIASDEAHIAGLLQTPPHLELAWIGYLRVHRPACIYGYLTIHRAWTYHNLVFSGGENVSR